MVKIGDRVQIYETCSNYYGRCGIVIGEDFCPTFPYKVEFEDGDDCIFKGKDLIVLSTEEETTMLFEVGDEVRVRQPTNLFHSELGKVVSIDHVKLMYKVIFHRGNSDVYTCFDLILVKRQGETSMKFKVGDKVKVSDSWRGASGKVGTISRTDWGTMYKYRVEFEDADPESFKEEELESVKEEEEVMKFKVGDKVKVRDSWFGHDGDIGEIIGADDRYEFKYTVAFDDGFAEPFREEELELVKEEEKVMKFKVGDKVRVIRNTYGNRGKIGTLEKIDDTTMPYCVVFDDGRKEWCYGHEFKLLKEEKVMKFKVGDKVRVIRNTYGNRGKIGTLEKIDDTTMPYCVVFDDGRKEWCYGHEFKLLKEEEVMKFKVGDKVKILNTEFGNKDKIGTITNISGTVLIYFVEIEGDYGHVCQWSNASDLELVTEEETSMKFKVGDKVKVSNSWGGNTGNVGEITERNGGYHYPYCVTFEVGNDESFKEEELELVKEKQSFTKSDLKTGMGVVLRDGTKGHVLLDTVAGDVIRFISEGINQWGSVDEYDENMIDCNMNAMDIVEVYSSKYAHYYLTDRVFNQECVFKREEPKPEPKPEPEPTKMTMKEINEHFGKPIEIVE